MILKICPSGQYFWKNKWKPYKDLDSIFTELFGKTLKELGIQEIPLNPGIKKACKIEKNGKKTTLNIEITLCPKASRETSKYFEGVLQLKHSNKKVVDFIHGELEKQKPKGVFITKEKIGQDRSDFFITDQTYLKSLAVKIQKEFGGTISLNPTLFSRDRHAGKDLYRLTLLLELPTIAKNNIIVVGDKLYKVSSVQQKINVQDFNGKKTSFPYKEHEVLEKQETRITKIYPEIEIIDPDSYQSSPIKNKSLKKQCVIDQKVKVVYYEGWWIVE